MPPEDAFDVRLHDLTIGTLHRRGDYTWFVFDEGYRSRPSRPVLGLRFEDDLTTRPAAKLRLPPWFSNLLPEGVLRTWIADERGVSPDREMELLAQVGRDLPGAVTIVPAGERLCSDDGPRDDEVAAAPEGSDEGRWRFSLAGVGLKFSMLRDDDRFTAPASGVGGDWIVKLPDRANREVPRNELLMMDLASAVGIEVPETRLVHRDQIDGLPTSVWPEGEDWAYAIRRFDRDQQRRPVHIEDMAQVRGFYPVDKYLPWLITSVTETLQDRGRALSRR